MLTDERLKEIETLAYSRAFDEFGERLLLDDRINAMRELIAYARRECEWGTYTLKIDDLRSLPECCKIIGEMGFRFCPCCGGKIREVKNEKT